MSGSKNHIVAPGETLSGIAKKYNMPSAESIWSSPQNSDLRVRRSQVNRIQPKDLLVIPPHPITIIDQKIVRLKEIASASRNTFDNLLKEEDNNYREVRNWMLAVDTAAMFASLAKMVRSGLKSMSLTGAQLAKANKDFAVGAVINGPKTAGIALVNHSKVLDKEATDGMLLTYGKKALEMIVNCESPSYWAQQITGVNPDQVHQQTRSLIMKNRMEAEANISKRIQALEEQRKQLRMQGVR